MPLTSDASEELWNDAWLPRPSAWERKDHLTPRPPKGWLRVIGLSPAPQVLDVGAWIHTLDEVHYQEGHHFGRQRLHMVARYRNGSRLLLVDPQLGKAVTDTISHINDCLDCTCGGLDCLESGTLLYDAARTFARRVWDRMTPADRVDALLHSEDEPVSLRHASEDASVFMADRGRSMYLLEEIAGLR